MSPGFGTALEAGFSEIKESGEVNAFDRELTEDFAGNDFDSELSEDFSLGRDFENDLVKNGGKETDESDNAEADLGQTLDKYFEDLKDKSECSETIPDRPFEATDECFSTYDERIRQTPRETSDRGVWTGERGESKYIPSDRETKIILEKYSMDGVEYKNGMPDFSKCAESTAEIDGMTERRYGPGGNFEQCDQKCAEIWNQDKRGGRSDWTARDVANWRSENGYSWHERNDMKTCDLVPTEINDYFGHLGGVCECKKRDAQNKEGVEFDE